MAKLEGSGTEDMVGAALVVTVKLALSPVPSVIASVWVSEKPAAPDATVKLPTAPTGGVKVYVDANGAVGVVPFEERSEVAVTNLALLPSAEAVAVVWSVPFVAGPPVPETLVCACTVMPVVVVPPKV